jgi:hypothetical protein
VQGGGGTAVLVNADGHRSRGAVVVAEVASIGGTARYANPLVTPGAVMRRMMRVMGRVVRRAMRMVGRMVGTVMDLCKRNSSHT